MKVAMLAKINLKFSLANDEWTEHEVKDLAYDKALKCFRFVYREKVYWVPRREVLSFFEVR